MIERNVMVKIASGLDSRPVAMLVQLASQFQSSIYISLGDKRVNAKSIMGMMSIGAIEGEELLIAADGEDEEEAVNHIEEYLTESE